jgi:hypothetical protein
VRLFLALLLLGGCGFELSPAGVVSVDASSDGPQSDGPQTDALPIDAPVTDIDAPVDAPIPVPLDIAHVSAADDVTLTSAVDYTLSGAIEINTTTGTVSPAPPIGVIVRPVMQEGGGLSLLVISARRIDVAAGATVRIRGTRGVVFVAQTDLVVAGTLDASADLAVPGPGGYPPSQGPGAGPDAIGSQGYETGGAGASFATRGGAGGNATGQAATAPAPIAEYGTAALVSLEGGSGGGNGRVTAIATACGVGGAGGGAIQLSAASVTVSGLVRASGGGGEGGRRCTVSGTSDASSGSGGGSGGAIYLQASTVSGAGWLVANGGGGGGGGCVSCAVTAGTPGDDGHDNATVALGGTSPLTPACLGGAGAIAAQGSNGIAGGNGGGGGGGVGRIFLAIPAAAAVPMSSSPPAQR